MPIAHNDTTTTHRSSLKNVRLSFSRVHIGRSSFALMTQSFEAIFHQKSKMQHIFGEHTSILKNLIAAVVCIMTLVGWLSVQTQERRRV